MELTRCPRADSQGGRDDQCAQVAPAAGSRVLMSAADRPLYADVRRCLAVVTL